MKTFEKKCVLYQIPNTCRQWQCSHRQTKDSPCTLSCATPGRQGGPPDGWGITWRVVNQSWIENGVWVWQTLHGNCQRKKMCKARSRKRWRSKTIDQAARALIRIGWNLARHKLNKPSLQVPMELDESSTRQGSKHADEVIPTLFYPWIIFSNNSYPRRLPDTLLSD